MANQEKINLLSKYQMRVLYYKCKEGLTHAEIAEKLNREVNTVQYHMTNIYTILEIKQPGKSKDEMDAELKNEICPIIREMFDSFDEIKLWAPQPSYSPPPSLEKILNRSENQSTPFEVFEPPPPGIRRVNWRLIIGGVIGIGLLIIVIAAILEMIINPDPTQTPTRSIPTQTTLSPNPMEDPTTTSGVTKTVTQIPMPSLTLTLTPTPSPTEILRLTPTLHPTSTPTEIIMEDSPIDGMTLVQIPAGEFLMGAQRPQIRLH